MRSTFDGSTAQTSSMAARIQNKRINSESSDQFRQFGALCYRNTFNSVEILLITTRQSKRWMIPKGWPIPGLDPAAVVEQEAWEEAGVVGNADQVSFGRFQYDKLLPDGRSVRPIVEVHLLKVRKNKKRFPEVGERHLLWVSAVAAADRVDEPELKKLLMDFGSQTTLRSLSLY